MHCCHCIRQFDVLSVLVARHTCAVYCLTGLTSHPSCPWITAYPGPFPALVASLSLNHWPGTCQNHPSCPFNLEPPQVSNTGIAKLARLAAGRSAESSPTTSNGNGNGHASGTSYEMITPAMAATSQNGNDDSHASRVHITCTTLIL